MIYQSRKDKGRLPQLPHHIVVGSHRKHVRGGQKGAIVQSTGSSEGVKDRSNAALGDKFILAGLDIETCVYANERCIHGMLHFTGKEANST